MFGRSYSLFRILGFDVKANISWLIIAVLITWSLATGLFPSYYPDLGGPVYWGMGVFGAIGLFASIIVHELSHSLVARRFDIQMTEITLFIFGGVANMEDEPATPGAEFWMAIAGPLASIAIGGVFLGVFALAAALHAPAWLIAVLNYLWFINFALAVFNLVPAYPLDGGRVLRAALWKARNSLRWATRIASYIGSGFAYLLMAFGVYELVRGNFGGGIWWMLIGFFLSSSSQVSYRRVLMVHALKGQTVRRFMKTDPVTVARHIPLEEFLERYAYEYHFKMFPVLSNDDLLGCVVTQDLRNVNREVWDRTMVSDIMRPCTEENTIGPDEDATTALKRMNRTGNSRLMVVEEGRLVGVLSLKDLLRFLSTKLDLEEEQIRSMRTHR